MQFFSKRQNFWKGVKEVRRRTYLHFFLRTPQGERERKKKNGKKSFEPPICPEFFPIFLWRKNKCRAGEESERKIKQIWRIFECTQTFSIHQLFCKSVWTRYVRPEEAEMREEEWRKTKNCSIFIEYLLISLITSHGGPKLEFMIFSHPLQHCDETNFRHVIGA